MERRIPAGRRAIALGVRLVFGLTLEVLLAGCGGDNAPPPNPEDAEEVVVRVSGTEGIEYSGDYSTLEGDLQQATGALEGEPVEYAVDIQEGVSDGVTAFFRKTQPGAGELKAEILADDTIVTESTTYAELGSVIVDWLPESDVQDLPAGDLPEEVPPPVTP